VRLGFARARLANWEPVLRAMQIAERVLTPGGDRDGDKPGPADREVLEPLGCWHLARELAPLLGREPGANRDWWTAAVATRTAGGSLTGAALRDVVHELALEAKRDTAAVAAEFGALVRADRAEWEHAVSALRGEEESLAAAMRAARVAARAARAFADESVVDRVLRVEAHLTRQLGLTLDLLARLAGGSPGTDADRAGPLVRRIVVGSDAHVMDG
jgi:hypothetical protein